MNDEKTAQLREDHDRLLPGLDGILAAADLVGGAPWDAVRRSVEQAHDFLVGHLAPHAEVEELVLYPAVGRALGSPAATLTMSRDHVEVGRLTRELGRLRERAVAGAEADLATDLRRVLYGVHAILRLHFAKEEEIYLQILEEKMSAQEASELLEALHHRSVAPTAE